MGLMLRGRKYFKQARTFIGLTVVFGFFAAGFSVNPCVAEEENSKEVNTIADYIKQEEKALNEKISKYLKDAERELYENDFPLARIYIEKASKIKESGWEKIRKKVRELAEKEVYRKREREELKKLGNQTERIRGKRAEAQALLKNIASAEEAFREKKRAERNIAPNQKEQARKIREQKREEQKRVKKERELRIQTEKMEKYLAEAEKFLEKDEFSKARVCVKKVLAIKDGSQKNLEVSINSYTN